MVLLRNKLKYALTGQEVKMICKQRLVQVDGKVRSDTNYPAGFMDVVTIEKTNEHFRLLYDVRGRFVIHRIQAEEAKYKLLKVLKVTMGAKSVPCLVTHDGRTIRYPDPNIKANDTVKFDLETGKITDFFKYETGNLAMVTVGKNCGRVGVLMSREKHQGSFDIAHLKDSAGKTFATRMENCAVIGKGTRPMVSLPKRKGIKLTPMEEFNQKKP